MNVFNQFQKYLPHLQIGAVLSCILFVCGGLFVFPQIFYDQWIWRYYWGPVVSDAMGKTVWHNGISAQEGYTYISEITYGIILLISLYYIYKLLKRMEVKINWQFCVALLPYIIFGPVTRVLEDTGYFTEPFVYWFISPLIYLQIAVFALIFIFLGVITEKKQQSWTSKGSLLRYFILFLGLDFFYTLGYLIDISYGSVYIHPLMFLVLSLFSFLPLVYRYKTKKRFDLNTIIFSGGLFFLLPSLYLVGNWILGLQWGPTAGVRFDVFLLITILVSGITGLVYVIARKNSHRESFSVYTNPLNLSMLVGHMIDGFTSYVSIYDPLHMGLPTYLEKHPGSNFLLELWPPLFPIVKILLILTVIYLFDVVYKKELKGYGALINLLKIGVLILGFSPGLRDLLRVTMGV